VFRERTSVGNERMEGVGFVGGIGLVGPGGVRCRTRGRVSMSRIDRCPSAGVLQTLILQREYRFRGSSTHIQADGVADGTDSSFILQDEGFAGVADTGAHDLSSTYGDVLATRIRYENRTLLDNVVRKLLFSAPEARWTSMSKYIENALSLLTFPKFASTCILSLEDQKLRAAWVGSSGFIVIRGDMIVYSSLPSAVDSLESSLSNQRSAPNPLVAESAVIDVEEEDLIVLATDGLWDNVTDCQVLSYLRPQQIEGFVTREWDDPKRQSSTLAYLGTAYADLEERDCFVSNRFVSGATHDDVTAVVLQIAKRGQ